MFEDVINFIQEIYQTTKKIPLHEPKFIGNEITYINQCINSTLVSSIGNFVDDVETKISTQTGSKYVIATTNGTSALHISLILGNVDQNDEVITQPLNFVASCNAISYCGAKPLFVDVDIDTMGLSPTALRSFLKENTTVNKYRQCINNKTGRVIKACIPMHSYGHPCKIDIIREICDEYFIFFKEFFILSTLIMSVPIPKIFIDLKFF